MDKDRDIPGGESTQAYVRSVEKITDSVAAQRLRHDQVNDIAMSRAPALKEAPSEQHARFIETARALGCDEDEAAFDEKLKVIARHKPADESKQSKKPNRR